MPNLAAGLEKGSELVGAFVAEHSVQKPANGAEVLQAGSTASLHGCEVAAPKSPLHGVATLLATQVPLVVSQTWPARVQFASGDAAFVR